jgi:hypothetical protein
VKPCVPKDRRWRLRQKNEKPPRREPERFLDVHFKEGILMKFIQSLLPLLQIWQRPTLPRLETEYHRRRGVSRPSSEWDRVQPPRHSHQIGERGKRDENWSFRADVSSGISLLSCSLSVLTSTSRTAFWALLNESNQASRAISTDKLHTLRCFHTRPINVVVFHGSQGSTRFEVGFPLRCLQRLSRPHIATLLCRWRDNRSTRGASIPVLSY